MDKRTFLLSLGVVAAAAFTAGTASSRMVDAPDPVPLYPENYKVLLENEHVRVVDFKLRKGATEMAHSHPRHVAVFLADFKIRFMLPDGKTAIRDAHAGDVAYSERVVHASENIGNTDAHGILVELKDKN
ncbi:MAG: hypothetical protein ACT4NU_01025 [Chromatiales bacterium]